MRGKWIIGALSCIYVFSLPQVSAEEKVKFLFTSDTYITAIDLSGPGKGVANLPANYDITLLEMGWGGKQALFNGSGITTNTSYPLPEGDAITTQEQVGASAKLPHGEEVGFLWQLYAAGGSRPVGRTFGAQLPWNNADREADRINQPDFETEIGKAWIKDTAGKFTYDISGGNLDAIELSRKDSNYITLGSVLFRPPVTTSSVFGKTDRRLQPGRHVMRGADALVGWEYAEDKKVKGELFFGLTKPTPVQEIDRDALGVRLSSDILEGNIAATYAQSIGERNPSITGERQTLWALDSSYNFTDWMALYGLWAHTGYHRNNRLHSNAWISGLRFLCPKKKVEWKAQYQYVGENYDLIGYHKIEHYPSNFHGINTSLAVPLGPASIKGLLYRLHQIQTNTRPGDTIFGDSYFPAITNSKRGDITAYRLAGDYDLGKHEKGLPKLTTYLEQARFQKDAPDSANNDIDKLVTNWKAGIEQPLIEGLTFEAGWRLETASGRWQSMRFHHRQGIPEAAFIYRIKEKDKDKFRVAAIYHYYDFVDSIAASSGDNSYQGQQFTFEVFYAF